MDAVIFAAIIGGAVILGFVPLDAGSGGSIDRDPSSIASWRSASGRTSRARSGRRRRHVHPADRLGRGDPRRPARLTLGAPLMPGGAKLKAKERKERHNRRVAASRT